MKYVSKHVCEKIFKHGFQVKSLHAYDMNIDPVD